jgi:TolB protein
MNKTLVVLVSIFALLACSTRPKEDLQVKWKIAYNVWYDTAKDDYEIFIMNIDGSEKKNISNWEGVDWVYYAYQDRIFFISDRDTTHRKYQLFEMDADGNNVRKITDFLLNDSWMDSRIDGKEMIVSSKKDGATAFHIIDMEGNEIEKVVPPGLARFNDPLFVNNGTQIVFRGSIKNNFELRLKNDPSTNDELYVMNVDGTGSRQITNFPAGDTLVSWFAYHAGPPQWSPSEEVITYQSMQDGKYHLYAVSLDGSRQFKLTNNEQSEGWHDWSDDGKFLAIETFDRDQTIFDIYLMNWETKELTRLTDDWRYEQAPVFVKARLE